jgi:NADH-quinone oxidoreductase subunit N
VPQEALAGALANDGIAFFTRLTVYLAALLVIPIGYGYLQDRRINRAEVEPLLLLSVVGMVALATANDLITLFVALEVLSLALYVLAGLARRDRRSQEASLKYFVMGAVASAILLYGMALLYVATGHARPAGIGAPRLVTTPRIVAVLGLALVTVGIGFKVALVPVPPVDAGRLPGGPDQRHRVHGRGDQGRRVRRAAAPLPRRLPRAADAVGADPAVLAAITMLYGAYLALVQRDLKRMLAYSSITHAGYARSVWSPTPTPGCRRRCGTC